MDGAKYKELVKKAIGKRTQKEFAHIAGISPYSITRVMTSPDDKVPVPRLDTVQRIAGASEGRVTDVMLLAASGLMTEIQEPPYDIGQEANRNANKDERTEPLSIAMMLRDAVARMAGSAMKYDGLKTFLETAAITAGLDTVRVKAQIDETPDVLPDGAGVLNSESLAHCTYRWRNGVQICTLYLSLHYCKTSGGGVIVSGATFDLTTLTALQHGGAGMFLFRLMEKGNVNCADYTLAVEVQDDSEAMRRLLHAIFGDDDDDFEQVVES